LTPRPGRSGAAGTRQALAKGDADKLVTELVKRHNDGEYRAPDKATLGEYLTERWLPAQRSQLKATTFHSYESNVRLHVLPTLGKVPLSRLAPKDLDELYGRLLESGRRNKVRRRTKAESRQRSLCAPHPAQGAR